MIVKEYREIKTLQERNIVRLDWSNLFWQFSQINLYYQAKQITTVNVFFISMKKAFQSWAFFDICTLTLYWDSTDDYIIISNSSVNDGKILKLLIPSSLWLYHSLGFATAPVWPSRQTWTFYFHGVSRDGCYLRIS